MDVATLTCNQSTLPGQVGVLTAATATTLGYYSADGASGCWQQQHSVIIQQTGQVGVLTAATLGIIQQTGQVGLLTAAAATLGYYSADGASGCWQQQHSVIIQQTGQVGVDSSNTRLLFSRRGKWVCWQQQHSVIIQQTGQVGLLTAPAATLGYYSADGASGSVDSSSSNTRYYSADRASGSVDSSSSNTRLLFSRRGKWVCWQQQQQHSVIIQQTGQVGVLTAATLGIIQQTGQVGLLTAAAATLGYYSADGASGCWQQQHSVIIQQTGQVGLLTAATLGYYSADGASGSTDSSNTRLLFSRQGKCVCWQQQQQQHSVIIQQTGQVGLLTAATLGYYSADGASGSVDSSNTRLLFSRLGKWVCWQQQQQHSVIIQQTGQVGLLTAATLGYYSADWASGSVDSSSNNTRLLFSRRGKRVCWQQQQQHSVIIQQTGQVGVLTAATLGIIQQTGQVGLLTAAAATLGYYSADGASGCWQQQHSVIIQQTGQVGLLTAATLGYYSADGASGSTDSSNTRLLFSRQGKCICWQQQQQQHSVIIQQTGQVGLLTAATLGYYSADGASGSVDSSNTRLLFSRRGKWVCWQQQHSVIIQQTGQVGMLATAATLGYYSADGASGSVDSSNTRLLFSRWGKCVCWQQQHSVIIQQTGQVGLLTAAAAATLGYYSADGASGSVDSSNTRLLFSRWGKWVCWQQQHSVIIQQTGQVGLLAAATLGSYSADGASGSVDSSNTRLLFSRWGKWVCWQQQQQHSVIIQQTGQVGLLTAAATLCIIQQMGQVGLLTAATLCIIQQTATVWAQCQMLLV